MLSVIIPTCDRPSALHDCLEALVAQDAAADELEVVVVDDGGRSPAAAVVTLFGTRIAVRCHRQENLGPATARNVGAQLARGDQLAFLDDDCQVMPGWLAAVRARCRRHPDAMIGGATLNALTEDPYAACHQLVLEFLYTRFNAAPEAAEFCASNNLIVPTTGFRAVGGFDAAFRYAAGEDRDLCRRWRQSGRPLVYAAEVGVRHVHAMTLFSFLRQHFHYGRGARRFHRVGRERQPWRPPGEELGFYLGLLSYPFGRTHGVRPLRLFPLLLASQAVTVCGYAVETVAGHGSRSPKTVESGPRPV